MAIIPLSMHDPPAPQLAAVAHCERHLPSAHVRPAWHWLLVVQACSVANVDPALELLQAGATSARDAETKSTAAARRGMRDAGLVILDALPLAGS
jgi:hypothetical protein